MPPKARERITFPGLRQQQDDSNDAEEDSAQRPGPSFSPRGFLRRDSAVVAETRIAATDSRTLSSTRSQTRRTSRPAASGVSNLETASERSARLGAEINPASRSARERQGQEEVISSNLGRAAKRTKVKAESDADDSEVDTRTEAAKRSALWRKKQKLKLQEQKEKTASSSSQKESQPAPYVESVEEILSRSPPPDEPEYISNETARKGFKGYAPLIGGATGDEQIQMKKELWEKGKFDVPEGQHASYLKAKDEEPGNSAKRLFYQDIDPKVKAPSTAGGDQDPLELDPPSQGGPFDALKFPERLVEQLNRDDGWTIKTWGAKALSKIPAKLMVRIKSEVLAQMPDEVLGRQQQVILDKLSPDHSVFNPPQSDNVLHTQPTAATSSKMSSNATTLEPIRDSQGKLLQAPLRGQGGKFLTKEQKAAFLASGTLPPPGLSMQSSESVDPQESNRPKRGNQNTKLKEADAATPAPTEPPKRRHGNQWTKRREAREAAALAASTASALELKQESPKKKARVIHVGDGKDVIDGSAGKDIMSSNSSIPAAAKEADTPMKSDQKCDQCKAMGVKCNGGLPECHWCVHNGLRCSFLDNAESENMDLGGEGSDDQTTGEVTGEKIAKVISNATKALETTRELDLDRVSYNLHVVAPKASNAGHIPPGHAIGYSHEALPHAKLPHDPKYVRVTPAYNPLPQEENFVTRPSIRIIIPDHLKNLLVDDWENVTKSMLLVPLPSQAPANYIIDSYFEDEKANRRLGSAEADILEEFCAGLKMYFEKSIGKILLYRFERAQLAEVRKLWESGAYRDWVDRGPGDCYGAEHLARMLVNMPELVAQTNMDAQSVARLKEEISKFCVWLARNANKYFVAKYEKPSSEYIENAR